MVMLARDAEVLTRFMVNTGHAFRSERWEAEDVARRVLGHMTNTGRFPIPGYAEFFVEVATKQENQPTFFSVWKKPERCLCYAVVCGAKPDAKKAWGEVKQFVERVKLHVANWRPVAPMAPPWVTVVCAPSNVPLIEATWVGDFIRCLTWALVEKDREGQRWTQPNLSGF